MSYASIEIQIGCSDSLNYFVKGPRQVSCRQMAQLHLDHIAVHHLGPAGSDTHTVIVKTRCLWLWQQKPVQRTGTCACDTRDILWDPVDSLILSERASQVDHMSVHQGSPILLLQME
jgi:hypothetical protein